MKNFAKFLLFVLVVSVGISLLYDYRLKHGKLELLPRRTSEKYTFASEPAINPKETASLEALNQERRALVQSVLPSGLALKALGEKGSPDRDELRPFEAYCVSADLKFSGQRQDG